MNTKKPTILRTTQNRNPASNYIPKNEQDGYNNCKESSYEDPCRKLHPLATSGSLVKFKSK